MDDAPCDHGAGDDLRELAVLVLAGRRPRADLLECLRRVIVPVVEAGMRGQQQADVDDVLQDVLTELARPEVAAELADKAIRSPALYARGVARNRIRLFYRRQRRSQQVKLVDPQPGGEIDPPITDDGLENFACEEVIAQVLPPLTLLEKQILYLRLLDWTYKEILSTLGMTEGRLKRRLQNIRKESRRFFPERKPPRSRQARRQRPRRPGTGSGDADD